MARQPMIRQYVVIVPAGEASRPSPAVGMRVMLSIQNTGANPGLVRFADVVRLDGGDMVLAAGQFSPLWNQRETCPNEALNFYSAAGTTFSVLEMVER